MERGWCYNIQAVSHTMNYPQSQLILDEIKKANKILLNCHRSPDPDSIGSTLALKIVLEGMGKIVEIVCPSEELDKNVSHLKGYSDIKKKVSFNNFNFSVYDLFISTDSSSVDQITGQKGFEIKGTKVISVDHHVTNTKFADITLLDGKVTSVGELMFLIFEDWQIVFSKEIADCLMAAIVGDTGAFKYPGVSAQTFKVASKLMEYGADKDFAVDKIYRSEPFELIKFYGEALSRVQLDKKNKFVWAAIPHEIYAKLNKPALAKESTASLFAQVVEGTDFGFIALEMEKGKLAISFRSRTGFDTSKLAVELGGGGHVYASGGKVEGLPFDQAVEKVLEVCRKYANKNS